MGQHGRLLDAYSRIENGLKTQDRDRLRRALSWLERAEQTPPNQVDERFLFLWIGFNATYAKSAAWRSGAPVQEQSETALSRQFLQKIVRYDRNDLLQQLMTDYLADSIKLLVSNNYVFSRFWSGDPNWREQFDRDNRKLQEAFRKRNTASCFYYVLIRLHVLRNQLVHGGTTLRSEFNRKQVEDGAKIMARLTPAVIDIMIDHLRQYPDTTWGKVPWPRQDSPNPIFPVQPAD